MLRAPTRPYRIGHPYWKRGERPARAAHPGDARLRLPFIGTSLTVAGPLAARQLARTVVGEPLVNLELHGIDVLDTGDGLDALSKHQPDVKIPYKRKLEALTAVVETLREAGYRFVRLDEAARAFA